MARKKYYKNLKDAKREAEKRGKSVYKIKDGVYFVGTYKEAIKAIQRVG